LRARRTLGGMSYYSPQYSGYDTPHPYRRSAPASIHVVAVLQYLGGALVLLVAGLLGVAGAVGLHRFGADLGRYRTATGTVIFLAAAFVALIGIIAIWLGRKVQIGRNWARIVLIILNALSVLGTFYRISHEHLGPDALERHVGGYLGELVLPMLCFLLLNTRAARSWCRYRTY
jgi:hypothetical protein